MKETGMPDDNTVNLPISHHGFGDKAASPSTLFERSNLTKSQFLIWAGQKLSPSTPLYNMVLTFTIQGAVDPDAFTKAFNAMVMHTDAMRTVIREVGGVPRQEILDHVPCPTEVLSLLGRAEPDQAFQTWLQKRSVRCLSLDQCLYDSALVQISDEQYVWYLNEHHLITDGWSAAVTYRRMAEFYHRVKEGTLADAPPPPQCAQYLVYEKAFRGSKQYEKAARYWDQVLAGDTDPLVFYGRAVKSASAETRRVLCDLGKERTQKLRATAQERGVRSFTADLSLFNIFMTVLFATLHRVGHNRRVTIGTPSHNRSTPAFKETAGLFIEIQPMRIEMTDDETFGSLLKKVSVQTLSLFQNALPGTSDFSHNNSFNVLLNYIHASFPSFDGLEMRSRWVHSGYGDSRHNLRLQVHDFDDCGSFLLHFDLNRDVFGPHQQEAIIDQYVRLMDAFIDDREQVISRVDLLGEKQRDEIFKAYNDTAGDTPAGQTVVDFFETQAAKTAAAVAVRDDSDELTYQQLNDRTDRLAGFLRSNGVGKGDVVAVHLDRSIHVVVAFLGVLKAGAAYVPMDRGYTPDRLDFVLKETGAKAVLTQSDLRHRFKGCIAQVTCLDSDWPAIDQHHSGHTTRIAAPDDVAYLIYTSGSTGVPKGVMVTHAGLANYLWWARKTYAEKGKIDFPLFTSIAFDLTVTSAYVPLISGGAVVVYGDHGEKTDAAIMRVIEDDAVDIIKLTPSHLSLLRYAGKKPQRLRKLILGGEDLKCDLANSIFEFFDGRIEIFNEYGPTEATVGCMVYRFDPEEDVSGSVPIGRPADNVRIYVLDPYLCPVPVGLEGEVYIGGPGVALGYLKRPDLNEQCFVPDPFRQDQRLYRTGDTARWDTPSRLVFVGRRDGQVKIRGARVELGEVETAILAHSAVEACVVAVTDSNAAKPRQPDQIVHCIRCGLPSNFPELTMDDAGVCSICVEYETYRDQAAGYFKTMADLRRVLDQARQNKQGDYDCLALLSGGKDSTYALYRVCQMGFRPLVFSLDNGYISDGAKANIRRAVDGLGLELVWGSTPSMDDIFADSLSRHSNVCHGCFKTIYTLSINLARERGIKAIVTGLSRGQVFETRIADLFHSNVFDPESIDRTIIEARKAYHRMDDTVSKCLDVEIFKDDAVFDEIEFVDFYRYCSVGLDEMLLFLEERAPWVRPSDTGRSTNCLINEVGIYVHKAERGYHNYALPYSWDVRLGHKERDAALEELDDQIDEENVSRILHQIGYILQAHEHHHATKRLVAYYVAKQALAPNELRAALADALPDYMIPSMLVPVDRIPLNDRGKVDHRALAAMAEAASHRDVDYAAPRTEAEEKLATIWAQVLQIPQVGIHDNFFDLGGDSIINIQIIARANQEGLDLTPSQLFEHPTVAELASLPGSPTPDTAEQGPVTGELPLTPMQRWFFDLGLAETDHWNQAVWLTLNDDVDPNALEAALHAVVAHHDTLRLCFKNDGGEWTQSMSPHTDMQLESFDLTDISTSTQAETTDQYATQLHQSIDLKAGRVTAAALFKFADKQPKRMLWVAHHLAVDGLSWSYLISDLATAYDQILASQAVKLPAKTSSYKSWANELEAYASSNSVRGQLDHWIAHSKYDAPELPTDDSDGINTQASVLTHAVWLDPETTTQLVRDAVKPYDTSVIELLVAAFARWACGTIHTDTIRVDLESHGREELAKGVNLLRTVGWFTTLFPMTLDLGGYTEVGEMVRAVKEQLRSVPDRGVGYGALRALHDEASDALRRCPRPKVLFSYSGQAGIVASDPYPLGSVGPLLASHASENIRPHALVISAAIQGGRLGMTWSYSKHLHRSETLESWSSRYMDTLKEIIAHCTGASVGRQHAPSDFPLADMDQDTLAKLSSMLQDKEDG